MSYTGKHRATMVRVTWYFAQWPAYATAVAAGDDDVVLIHVAQSAN